MTYNVFSGTLNPAHSPLTVLQDILRIVHLTVNDLLLEFNVDQSNQMLIIFLSCLLEVKPSVGELSIWLFT